MKQHIRPRIDGRSGTETVCERTGLGGKVEGSTTSRVNVEVACPFCRVGVDALLESGDLLVVDGRWMFDHRPVEFRSVEAFIEFLSEEERPTFTVEELQELVAWTKEPYQATLAYLRRVGFRLEQRAPTREVRGIGRLKPAPRV